VQGHVVAVGAELDSGHVAQVHGGAVRVHAQDDVAELLRRVEFALCRDDRVELLAAMAGRPPSCPAATCEFWALIAAVMSAGSGGTG